MTAVLPSLALALLSLLRAGAEVPVQPGFNAEKFAGTWHVAAAASNCSVFLKMKDGMKSSITTISFTPEGDLAMKLLRALAGATEVLGLCHVARPGTIWGPLAAQEKRDLHVMETDYSRYAIVHELHPHFGCLAAAREQDVSPQLLQKFEELIPTMGLTKDMLAILPKSGECQEGTG
uniref:Lipocalin/cytosolic fatty-acid binding domain-containing protein n=1 Tax=Strix occidentalis caurina TaxID=311401 RepID=A0A8D0G0G3_STROC